MANIFSIGLIKKDEKQTDEELANDFQNALEKECKFTGTLNVTIKPLRKKT